MIKVTPIYESDITAMQKEFEAGKGFKAEEEVLESGVYDVFHDSNIFHENGLIIVNTLYKGDFFPSCFFCKPFYRITESKNYMD